MALVSAPASRNHPRWTAARLTLQGGIAPACIPVPAHTKDLSMEDVPGHLINTGDHRPDTIPTTGPEELLAGTDADIGLGPLTITTAPPALTPTPASLSLRTGIADLGDTGHEATAIAGHVILLRPPQAPVKDLLANDTIPQAHHLMAVHLATIRHHRRRRSSSSEDWPHKESVIWALPVPKRLARRIKAGKYVTFDKLLTPSDSPPLAVAVLRKSRRSREKKRSVIDLASWLEAWNRYLCTRLSFRPQMALELAKYQTLIVMLFNHYPPQACLRYDSLFRQAAGQDKALRWDTVREDIYVWCLARPHAITATPHHEAPQAFRDRPTIAFRLGPPVPNTDKTTHTAAGRQICRRYNFGKCTRGDECIFAHVCWHPGCQGAHPGRGCPNQQK